MYFCLHSCMRTYICICIFICMYIVTARRSPDRLVVGQDACGTHIGIYLCMCMYILIMYFCLYISTRTYVRIFKCICMYIVTARRSPDRLVVGQDACRHTYEYIYKCVYVYTFCVFLCIYMYMHIYMYMYVYIHVYVYVYIYTSWCVRMPAAHT